MERKTKAERREEQRNKDFQRTTHHGKSSGQHRENADRKREQIRKERARHDNDTTDQQED
jgi:hypothetical protein